MQRPFIDKYRGYTVRCTLQETHDARLLAFMVISHGLDPVCFDKAILLDLTNFAAEGEAAVVGLAAAMRWIDESGFPQPRPPRNLEVVISAPPMHAASVEYWDTRASGFMGTWDARP